MAFSREPLDPGYSSDTEFDATDGGWDPYVASLIGSALSKASDSSRDEDDTQPVMTISQRPADARK
jgi:hypothetical protein